MSEMIERVAEAMRLRAIERGHPIHPTMAHHLAAAAIEAMREPTQAMIAACNINIPTTGMITGIWADMIDAALEPPALSEIKFEAAPGTVAVAIHQSRMTLDEAIEQGHFED